MRNLVADTSAALWFLTESKRLSKRAHRLLVEADTGRAIVHVPAIVLVEVALLHERGRLDFGSDRVVALLARHAGWQVLAMDIEQSLAFVTLARIKDPMDRIVAAAAKALRAPLISADETFDRLIGVERIWD